MYRKTTRKGLLVADPSSDVKSCACKPVLASGFAAHPLRLPPVGQWAPRKVLFAWKLRGGSCRRPRDFLYDTRGGDTQD